MMDYEAINKTRVVYYGLFASALAFDFTRQEFKVIKQAVNVLSKDPINATSAKALTAMTQFIETHGFKGLKNESDQVFFSPTTSLVPMTASFYFEKRDDGTQRVEMIDYIFRSTYRKNSDTFKENEDHIEFIFLFIQQLIKDELSGKDESAKLAKEVFTNILNGMIDRLTENIFKHEYSSFYKQTAILLESFIAVERLFLDIHKPVDTETKDMTRPGLRKGKLPPRQMQKRNLDEFESI